MMTNHRVGRVELPWTNLIPPIRSQDYYPNLEKKKAKKDAVGLGHADGEKSRRGRSVDLGSVGFPHILWLSHDYSCMLPFQT